MSWLSGLASLVGIPLGAAMVAAAMYAACASAEKAARPEALKDIGRILNDPSWSRSVRPSAIIQRMFVWTFGERHWSLTCVLRSTLASLAVIVGTSVSIDLRSPAFIISLYINHVSIVIGLKMLLLLGFLPDYLSLGKTRLILAALERWRSALSLIFVMVADVALSVLISAVCLTVYNELATGRIDLSRTADVVWWSLQRIPNVLDKYPLRFILFEVFLLSTLLTSIWMVLVLVSSGLLKLFRPIQRFTAWFFDIDRHPVKAIGIVSGTLVMAGSLAWTILIHVL